MAKQTVGSLIDQLYVARQDRLAAEKKIEQLKAREAETKQKIIELLHKEKLNGAKGGVAVAAIQVKTSAQIMDREKFQQYVIDSKQIELMECRCSQLACKERWSNGVGIPGIEFNEYEDLSLNKAGGK